MTNPLPESAVELAARAIAGSTWAGHSSDEVAKRWGWMNEAEREPYRVMARAALPAIREAVVGEFKPLLEAAKEVDESAGGKAASVHSLARLRTALAAITEQENRNDQERSHDGG